MILSRAINAAQPINAAPIKPEPAYAGSRYVSSKTKAGQTVDEDTALGVAAAYRATNIISDDIAKMPLQQFIDLGSQKERVKADVKTRNMAYLLEISPNLWGWTPFQFKKILAQWLILWGNSYAWRPPVRPFQLFILPASTTYPVYDQDGAIWYATMQKNKLVYIPGPEVLHTLINPDSSGQMGRGIISYARESIGRQLGAYSTESKLYKNGMNPTAYMQVNASLDKEKREDYRESYSEVMTADYEGPRLAVFDNKIAKYETVSMSLVDAQFLELIGATDRDIANFFGMPLHMLNMGKEAYSSNEEKYLEYLNTTLDSYLVQFEQGARVKWLSESEQQNQFWKFNRDSLLRMNSKARAETNEILIRSGQRTPNEAREKDDFSAYADGENFYMTKNYAGVNQVDKSQANGSMNA
jgi:HK97 family phage portal protein